MILSIQFQLAKLYPNIKVINLTVFHIFFKSSLQLTKQFNFCFISRITFYQQCQSACRSLLLLKLLKIFNSFSTSVLVTESCFIYLFRFLTCSTAHPRYSSMNFEQRLNFAITASRLLRFRALQHNTFQMPFVINTSAFSKSRTGLIISKIESFFAATLDPISPLLHGNFWA